MATNRPEYRDSRTPRAVKVYTIAQESRYLLIENVPALNLSDELLRTLSKFGSVEIFRKVEGSDGGEQFSDVYWAQFDTIAASRLAKRMLDDKPFYANLLRISYDFEHETPEDIRAKIQDRQIVVSNKLVPSKKKFARGKKRATVSDEPPLYGPFKPTRAAAQPVRGHPTMVESIPAPKKRRRI
ncbi:uncharacterized protein BYT42DRAFT_548650 [Radiomyces spectabilis]|uniref:uncharacterized protein n=1 Tax=Radiomyces spectabilis TaxID=64574 RepID=UPI00222105E5|nr:uncharacterized protein BYT42DRAFT_548650 [Radiomyces spectabilis]KAI8370371.1 hypothetical protein BYT42DRAFT_548650 [Radiomyces spectabilis]